MFATWCLGYLLRSVRVLFHFDVQYRPARLRVPVGGAISLDRRGIRRVSFRTRIRNTRRCTARRLSTRSPEAARTPEMGALGWLTGLGRARGWVEPMIVSQSAVRSHGERRYHGSTFALPWPECEALAREQVQAFDDRREDHGFPGAQTTLLAQSETLHLGWRDWARGGVNFHHITGEHTTFLRNPT